MVKGSKSWRRNSDIFFKTSTCQSDWTSSRWFVQWSDFDVTSVGTHSGIGFRAYIAGPFCGALLADMGADVIRVDRVGGSEDRFVMPVTEQGDGAVYLQSNRNKRSITCGAW